MNARPVTDARVGVEVDGWREAIRAACQLLVDAGAVEARYAERCIAMVDEHGPYMVLAPGIALAHARPEDGVQAVGVSAVTLRTSVTFDHPENDPVHLVFAFGSPDREQHVGLLAALARRLIGGLADQLTEAGDDQAAQRLLVEALDDRG